MFTSSTPTGESGLRHRVLDIRTEHAGGFPSTRRVAVSADPLSRCRRVGTTGAHHLVRSLAAISAHRLVQHDGSAREGVQPRPPRRRARLAPSAGPRMARIYVHGPWPRVVHAMVRLHRSGRGCMVVGEGERAVRHRRTDEAQRTTNALLFMMVSGATTSDSAIFKLQASCRDVRSMPRAQRDRRGKATWSVADEGRHASAVREKRHASSQKVTSAAL